MSNGQPRQHGLSLLQAAATAEKGKKKEEDGLRKEIELEIARYVLDQFYKERRLKIDDIVEQVINSKLCDILSEKYLQERMESRTNWYTYR